MNTYVFGSGNHQGALHDDGYVVNSPSSVASVSSHTSFFTEGSPNTARTHRSGGRFTPMAPDSPTESNASHRTYKGLGLKRGLTPQVGLNGLRVLYSLEM